MVGCVECLDMLLSCSTDAFVGDFFMVKILQKGKFSASRFPALSGQPLGCDGGDAAKASLSNADLKTLVSGNQRTRGFQTSRTWKENALHVTVSLVPNTRGVWRHSFLE